MPISSIDDILTGVSDTPQTQPETPESKVAYPEEPQEEAIKPEENVEPNPEEPAPSTDEYGNEKTVPRTYTEEEVNERINKAIRERLARMERNQPQAPETKAAKGFEYDSNASGNWEEQLEAFVEKTLSKVTQRQHQQTRQHQEQQAEMAHAQRLQAGAHKFPDFMDVVSAQPITDAMTLATRGMSDPAAFLYAASKRHGDELQRISRLDPYAQMVEMGKLEERMKKSRQTTNAPRPLGSHREDISEPRNEKPTEPSIEELIQQSENRRLQKMKNRRR